MKVKLLASVVVSGRKLGNAGDIVEVSENEFKSISVSAEKVSGGTQKRADKAVTSEEASTKAEDEVKEEAPKSFKKKAKKK